MKLRDYQNEAVNSAIDKLQENRSTLVVLPTGAGKTIVFSTIIDRWLAERGGKALVLAHREELIWQGASKIESVTGMRPQIEMGEISADFSGDMFTDEGSVVVGTVQTLNSGRKCKTCQQFHGKGCADCIGGLVRRMQKFNPEDFSLIVTDEAHHGVAQTYRNIYGYFFDRNPEVRHLLVTATPDRADEKALGRICETVACEYNVLDMIENGWLVPIRQSWVTVNSVDLTNVRTTAGDLNEGDLEQILLQEEALHGIANSTIELAGERPTLIFAATVRHAEMICDIINRDGNRPGQAICITGTTDREDRRRLLEEYAAGRYQYLCGCGVFLEGFDEPRIACVSMARPTKSRSLYAQAIGRGTRPITPPDSAIRQARVAAIAASTKADLLVLDFVGNSGKHKLISCADVLGGTYDDEVVAEAEKIAKETGEKILVDTFEKAAEVIAERKRVYARSVAYSIRNMNPFDLFDVAVGREPGWHRGKPPTPAQSAALEKMGFKPDDYGNSFWKASRLLDAISKRRQGELATYKQVKTLARFGVNATHYSFKQASDCLNKIASNGWSAAGLTL